VAQHQYATGDMSLVAQQFTLPQTIRFIERDWLSANHVLMFEQHQATVIDTGYKKHQALTVQLIDHQLQQYQQTNENRLSSPVQLVRIINTHLHSDHCGGNAILQARNPSLQTLIPVACADIVRRWDETQLTYTSTNQECDPFTFTDTIAFDQQLQLGGFEWHALGAPGHDNTMFVLHCPELKLLISADALWENGFGLTFPELDQQSGFAEHRATLDRIAKLDVQWVIPGHGAPFTHIGAALDRAYSKLKYLSDDPSRHEKLAARVLLKFMLLDREKLVLAQLDSILSQTRFFKQIIDSQGTEPERAAFCNNLVDQLCSAGAARKDGIFVYNH
jgi:glyoxylase-like metal-dependent hydrolase (beta-lactamase superfamily II)